MAEQELRVIQLNTEGCREKTALHTYLLSSNADALILQEVFPHQVFYLAEKLNMYWAFLPMMRFAHDRVHKRIQEQGDFSVAILTKEPMLEVHQDYYPGHPENIPLYDGNWVDPVYGVLSVDIQVGESPVRIAGTHYPVSLHGLPDEKQRALLEPMCEIVRYRMPDIFAGDFNAPDKYEIGEELTQKYYRVPYPKETQTTLSLGIHRAGDKLPPDFRIDYIFLPSDKLTHGEMQMDYTVSDHAALPCTFYLR